MIQPAHERVTIVTVTHNSIHVLPEMLESIPGGTSVTVVDNASTDISPLEDLCQEKSVQLVKNVINEGFGSASNRGAALATTEFLLFLNPDALLQPGALDQLCSAADRFSNYTGFNPCIEDVDGKPFFKRRSHLLAKSEWMVNRRPTTDCEVPILSGAALFVRRADFEEVGGFDKNIFLFYEDDDLSIKLRSRGPLMFVSDARVCHAGGVSSGTNSDISTLKAWHMGHSRVYTTRKHKVQFARTRALTTALLRVLSAPSVLSSRERSRNIAYLNGVANACVGNRCFKRLNE